ncbi:MAG TPA: DUF4416 family protein [Anaerohalosphaeraceae bacterium]|nr:DUF4416 family protein [Phycisphaerae bacterium]HOK95086.1 DUF4416 family protein [Anaerohalosphaeraceae bacterium]HOL31181.1 DUF4416 family protein [Anaerohalosphaeraceae bacterium]HOM76005.1 DUF4416 family protein [Anaerohalosphaeraceae bacterium]HPC64589.1 DUF4416 family protein [Anaerohalosphaeraceae bacterium]
MWDIKTPKPAKLIVGILACSRQAAEASQLPLTEAFGPADLVSQIWPFDMTEYYADQAGPNIVRQFLAFETLLDPGRLAWVKHQTNQMEQELARRLNTPYPRPVNLDPGLVEPSKLVLASTKNFAHRIYIGEGIYAEVTMTYVRGRWETFPFTFPDFKSGRYNEFLNLVRQAVVRQQRELEK